MIELLSDTTKYLESFCLSTLPPLVSVLSLSWLQSVYCTFRDYIKMSRGEKKRLFLLLSITEVDKFSRSLDQISYLSLARLKIHRYPCISIIGKEWRNYYDWPKIFLDYVDIENQPKLINWRKKIKSYTSRGVLYHVRKFY